MRKSVFAVFFSSMALLSCSSDPVRDEHRTDSLKDTLAGNTLLDTAKNDTATTDQYNCSVLSRKIPDINNDAQIQIDLGDLSHCGVDSFDILYVVPNLFPGFVTENQTQGVKNITYADFIKHMDEFKLSPAYAQLHQRVNTLDSLKRTKFDQRKVYAMKPVLGQLGFTAQEWEMFSGFANTYPVPKKGLFTWGDMLNEFEKYSSTIQK